MIDLPPTSPEAPPPTRDPADGHASVGVLIVWVGGRRLAVLGAVVERVLPMAELTALPEPPQGIAGVLNVGGVALPVVDPRPRLGLVPPPAHPDQHLVLVADRQRYLLWVDRVEALESVPVEELPALGDGERRRVARLAGEAVPLLATDSLAPEPLARGTDADA